MRRFLVAMGAALGLLLMSAPVASAQDPDSSPACGEAIAQLTEAQAAHDAAVAADAALAEAEDAQAALDALPTTASDGTALVVTDEEIRRLSAIPEDSPNFDLAQEKIDRIQALMAAQAAVDALPPLDALRDAADAANAEALAGAVVEAQAAVDEACRGPQGDPGFVDLDCADFASQAAAQAKLDETPGEDPHNLDGDGDGAACASDEDRTVDLGDPDPTPTPTNDTDVDVDVNVDADRQVAVVPNDAPETGQLPAQLPLPQRAALAVLLLNLGALSGLYIYQQLLGRARG